MIFIAGRTPWFLCAALLLSCLLGLSACAEKETVYDAEDIAGMLMAFCTTDRDARYATYLAAMEAYEPPAHPDGQNQGVVAVEDEELDRIVDDYHRDLIPYLSEDCLDAVVSSRMLLRLDKTAAMTGSSVVPTEVTVEEDKEMAGKYLFTVLAVTTRSDGTETETRQSGYFVLRDGRVQELSFSGGDGFFVG